MEPKKQPQDLRSFLLSVPMLTSLVALGLVFLIGMSVYAFVRPKPKAPAAPVSDAAQTAPDETADSGAEAQTDEAQTQQTEPAASNPAPSDSGANADSQEPAPSDSGTELDTGESEAVPGESDTTAESEAPTI